MASRIRRERSQFIEDTTNVEASGASAFAAIQLADLIANRHFPCVGAKAAFAKDAFRIGFYESMTDRSELATLYQDLGLFVDLAEANGFSGEFSTFAAIFDKSSCATEKEFHNSLWQILSTLHQFEPAQRVVSAAISEDVTDPDFGFCIHGEAFFVVGLHPTSSRYSRKFAFPTLIFNRHDQFELLRQTGRFSKMQSAIRRREIDVQGSLNPNLADFGLASEALQYSGLPNVTANQCPFHKRQKEDNEHA